MAHFFTESHVGFFALDAQMYTLSASTLKVTNSVAKLLGSKGVATFGGVQPCLEQGLLVFRTGSRSCGMKHPKEPTDGRRSPSTHPNSIGRLSFFTPIRVPTCFTFVDSAMDTREFRRPSLSRHHSSPGPPTLLCCLMSGKTLNFSTGQYILLDPASSFAHYITIRRRMCEVGSHLLSP